MRKTAPYAVVVGSLNCDAIFLQDRLPDTGETFLARSARIVPGGKGGNQAVQMARLGLKTYMAGKVGPDHFGAFLTDQLQKNGVDTTWVTAGHGSSGLAAVHTLPDGSVHATVAQGANLEMTKADVDALRPLLEKARVLVLQMEIPRAVTEYAFHVARAAGVYVIFNAAPALDVDESVLLGADCLIVNETEAARYLGCPDASDVDAVIKAGREFAQRSRHTLIVTLGEKGGVLIHGNETHFFPVDLHLGAVETTGCGDSCVGAFAYQKAMGADDWTACRYAFTAAQLTATQVGAQSAMPTREEIEKFLPSDG